MRPRFFLVSYRLSVIQGLGPVSQCRRTQFYRSDAWSQAQCLTTYIDSDSTHQPGYRIMRLVKHLGCVAKGASIDGRRTARHKVSLIQIK